MTSVVLTIGKVVLYKAPVALIIALPLLHVLLWGAARDKVPFRIRVGGEKVVKVTHSQKTQTSLQALGRDIING